MSGDIMGHVGLTPPKFECLACGWREKLVLKVTNKPITVKDVVIMAEAKEAENDRIKQMRNLKNGTNLKSKKGR
jgi:hypothetical protein